MASDYFHPPPSGEALPTPYVEYNPNDPRWLAIRAFLKRNGAPDFIVARNLSPYPSSKHEVIFSRAGFESLAHTFSLVYRDPTSTLTELEIAFSFGGRRPFHPGETFLWPPVPPPPRRRRTTAAARRRDPPSPSTFLSPPLLPP